MKARGRLGKWLNRTWSHWRPSPTIVPFDLEPARRASARAGSRSPGGVLVLHRVGLRAALVEADHVDD